MQGNVAPRSFAEFGTIVAEILLSFLEFAKAPECPPLTSDDLAQIDNLYIDNFGLEPEEPKFKGTMELPAEVTAAL